MNYCSTSDWYFGTNDTHNYIYNEIITIKFIVTLRPPSRFSWVSSLCLVLRRGRQFPTVATMTRNRRETIIL